MLTPLVRLAAAFLIAASLGACELGSTSGEAARPQVQAPPVNTATVAQGDTVYRIAQRYKVSVRAVIDANHLSPPYRLLPGQHLVIPAIAEHVVQSGDTLRSISQRYGTTPAEVASLNNLRPPAYVIKVGQRLTLPSAVQTTTASPEPLTAKAERRPLAVQSQPLPDSSAPSLTGSRVLLVAMSPALGSEERGGGAPQPQSSPTPQPQPQAQPERAAQSQPQQPSAVQPVVARSGKSNPAAKPAEVYAPLVEPPPFTGGFAWPARGRLLARFGVLGKGQHNDGINIEVPRGAPIRAAADGVVAYAGNELRGFGNLLLIKHSDGWMSAYAHNDELVVRRGDTVRRGQVISKAGASGNVRSPQLHFELRKHGDAVDPQRHLPDYRVALGSNGAG